MHYSEERFQHPPPFLHVFLYAALKKVASAFYLWCPLSHWHHFVDLAGYRRLQNATQCETAEFEKATENQTHQPLAFLSAEFTGVEHGWTTFEKEGYAITQTVTRLDYMLQCEPLTRIFTDHGNLLFVFCPSLLDPSLGRHKVTKSTAMGSFSLPVFV